MSTEPSKQKQGPTAKEGTSNPASREQVKPGGVPDDSSSKAKPSAERDQRTGHDKDGNQEQGGRVSPEKAP